MSRAHFGDGAKYLTLWLSDGRTYVVRAGTGDAAQLNRYFGKAP